MYMGPQNKTTMCEILSVYKVEPDVMDNVACNDNIDESVYMNIVIVGIACIPTCIIVPLYVNKFGLRFFLGNLEMFFLIIVSFSERRSRGENKFVHKRVYLKNNVFTI